ncbi:MAG: hypothetical protein AAFR29_03955 [Pseudomonadota bacterium]
MSKRWLGNGRAWFPRLVGGMASGIFMVTMTACATAPGPTPPVLATDITPTQNADAAPNAPAPALLKAAFAAAAQEEPEGFSLCNCKEKVDPIKALLGEERALTRSLQYSLRTLRESFGYVEINWIKKALFSLDQYNAEDLEEFGPAQTVGGLDYNAATAEAVKNFQCLYYPKASDGTCDQGRTTGWITYPEARAAICTSGYAAKDDTAILLAGWYANGTVFERNLAFANWLVAKLSRNLPQLIQNAEEGPDREFYLAVESDARILQSFINSMVNAEAEIRGLTIAQRAALRGDVNAALALNEICPRGFTQ